MNRIIKRAVVLMMVFSFLLGSFPSFRGFVKAAGSDVIRNDETGIPVNLTQLQYLGLPNTVTDLSPIEGMTELSGLRVADANISALPDLTKHTKLAGHDILIYRGTT